MRKLLAISLIIVLLREQALTAPTKQLETDPELIAGFFEGDMVFSPLGRNGLREEVKRWPNRVVNYHISGDFEKQQRDHILAAIGIIEQNSCLIFKEVSADHGSYVNISSKPGGCFTAVGFQNKVQQMNLEKYPLDTGCFRMGTILHEFLHAMGFYHQQSTWNRDDYVRIAEENILEGKVHNFEKYDEKTVDNFDQEYDYASVMHYTAYGFSKNGEMTIVPFKKDAEKQMGQRITLSDTDIKKLNIMYKCPKHV